MAIPVYPEGLPYPRRESYGFTPTNNIRRTPMDSGRARQRIEFPNAPTMVSITWTLTAAQAMFFEAWTVQTVGAGWFTLPLLTPLGFEEYEVRFTEVPVGGELRGKLLWEYRVTCELRNRPLVPPDWMIIAPDYILYANIFDIAMNREWPRYFDYALTTEDGYILLTEDGFGLLTE